MKLIKNNSFAIKTPKIGSRVNFTYTKTKFDLDRRTNIPTQVNSKGVVSSISRTANGKIYNIKVTNRQEYHRIRLSQISHVWFVV